MATMAMPVAGAAMSGGWLADAGGPVLDNPQQAWHYDMKLHENHETSICWGC